MLLLSSPLQKLYVGGLDRSFTAKDLREYFTTFGEIEKIDLKVHPKRGFCRGFGFVIFRDPEVANGVASVDGHEVSH